MAAGGADRGRQRQGDRLQDPQGGRNGCRENHRAGRQLEDLDRRRGETGAEPGRGHAAQHPRSRHRLDRNPRREPRRVPGPRAGRLPDRGNGDRSTSEEPIPSAGADRTRDERSTRGLARRGPEADRRRRAADRRARRPRVGGRPDRRRHPPAAGRAGGAGRRDRQGAAGRRLLPRRQPLLDGGGGARRGGLRRGEAQRGHRRLVRGGSAGRARGRLRGRVGRGRGGAQARKRAARAQ